MSLRSLALAAAACGLMVQAAQAQPAASGPRAEARTMLEKAVAAVKADKAKALDMINSGDGGFFDQANAIFPFCFDKSDGKIVATQTKQALGKDIRTFKDKTGKAFGLQTYNDAKRNGRIGEVHYEFAKPGPDQTPVPKVSFVTGVDGLGCGVGYYP